VTDRIEAVYRSVTVDGGRWTVDGGPQ